MLSNNSLEKIFSQKHELLQFNKKVDALTFLKGKEKKHLYLFSEDISFKMQKTFFVAKHSSIFHLANKHDRFLYENFEKNEKIKLHLDIDIKMKDVPKKIAPSIYLDQVINSTILLINKTLNLNFTPQIILLTANREDKLSCHVIYKNVIFKDIYAIKYFMCRLHSKLLSCIDQSIYRTGCFRMLWNSKKGKNNRLEFYKGINYEFTNDRHLFFDCLLRHIKKSNYVVPFEAPNEVTLHKWKIGKRNSVEIEPQLEKKLDKEVVPISVLKKYVDIIDDPEFIDNYSNWTNILMALKNSNNSVESFNLWEEMSKRGNKYDSHELCIYKWNSFKIGKTKQLGIGTLKFLARKCNPQKYDEIEYEPEKIKFKTIKINCDFLLELNEKIKDGKSKFAQTVNKWYCDARYKTLGILSPYNTAKTSTIYKIIVEYNPKRILFVSYRQSLSGELFGNFSELSVASYMYDFGNADRIICQIESLDKLLFINADGLLEIPKYDLVILDEIESDLAHFRSPTIKDNVKSFELLKTIIKYSTKVLALDGDFHNRAFSYLDYFGKSLIVENICQKNKKKFIFTNDRILFDRKITKAIKKGENIVIVSMSSTEAEDYYNKMVSMKVKVILHTSKTNDQLKEELKDVNKLWSQYNVLIYSPTIESGVDMNLEHFDRIFVVLSACSTSPRGLLQMCARVRKIKHKNIYLYTNKLPYKEKASFYTFAETEDYVLDLCNKYMKPIITDNLVKFKYDLFTQNLIYNETEYLNKSPHYFIPYLIQLLTKKGHKFKFIPKIKHHHKPKKVENVLDFKKEILEAPTINNEEYEKLLKKQNRNRATRQEKATIEKYLYMKYWNLKKLTEENLDDIYRKTHMLINLKKLIQDEDNKFITTDEKYARTYDEARMKEQMKIIKKLIKLLGFDNINDKKLIPREIFNTNVDQAQQKSILFTKPSFCQQLFGFSKIEILSMKSFLGFINKIFRNWGFKISFSKKTVGKKGNENYYNITFLFDKKYL